MSICIWKACSFRQKVDKNLYLSEYYDCLCTFREQVIMRLKSKQRKIHLTVLPLTHLWKKLAQRGKNCGVQPTLFGYLTNPCISQGERSLCVLTGCFLGDIRAGIFARGKGTHNLVSVFWKNVGYRTNTLHFIFIVTYLCYKEGTYTVLKVMLFIHWYLPFIFIPHNKSLLLNICHLEEKL